VKRKLSAARRSGRAVDDLVAASALAFGANELHLGVSVCLLMLVLFICSLLVSIVPPLIWNTAARLEQQTIVLNG
jgi:hypothetical protein